MAWYHASMDLTAWAAGLYEGEGSVSVVARKRGGRPLVNITLTTTDRDVMDRFAAVVECGGVYDRPNSRHHKDYYKHQYRWSCGRAADIERVLTMFYPYLGERRQQQADAALAAVAGVKSRRPHTRSVA